MSIIDAHGVKVWVVENEHGDQKLFAFFILQMHLRDF